MHNVYKSIHLSKMAFQKGIDRGFHLLQNDSIHSDMAFEESHRLLGFCWKPSHSEMQNRKVNERSDIFYIFIAVVISSLFKLG